MILSRPLVGHIAMVAFATLVSFSFTFTAMVADDIDAGVLTSLRFVIATTVLVAVVAVSGGSIRDVVRQLWRWLIVGGFMAVYFITMVEALSMTTPLATSSVFTLTPLIAAGFGWLLIGAKASLVMLAALTLGGIGAVWVIFKGDIALLLAMDVGPGERLFFVGVVAHAAVPALTRRLVPDTSSLHAALGTSIGALVVASLYAFPTTIVTDFAALKPLVWYVAFYLGVVATAVTFFLLQVGIARITPGKVMAYTYLVPSLVVVQGLAFRGESEPARIYLGIALTLIALMILVFQDAKDVPPNSKLA